MSARPQDAERFLRFAFSGGPWKLTAMLDRGERSKLIETKTFDPDRAPSMLRWAEEKNTGGWNIYFQIASWNRTKDAAKKISREDVTGVSALWVDIDCGPGSVSAVCDQFARPAYLANKKLPIPSLLLQSGNGVWAFWLLDEPLTDTEEVAQRNAAIANRLRDLPKDEAAKGMDSAGNADRIARVPGFINWPDDKKKAKGYTETLATWYSFTTEPVRYSIKKFSSFGGASQGAALQKKATGAGVVSSAPVPVADLSDLGLDPDNGDWLAAVIVSGHPKEVVETGWPEQEPEKGGRSETVLSAACELVRRGVAPEKIAGALLNRAWAISAHIYAQPHTERYAVRQVERALEMVAEAAEEAVRSNVPPWKYDPDARVWMNLRFATVNNYGGRYRVMARPGVDDPTLPAFLEAPQWAHRFDGHLTGIENPETGEVKPVPLAKVWLNDRDRARHSRVIFDPAGEDPDQDAYNLWTGFVTPNEPTECEDYLALTRDVIADGSEEVAEYLLNWMALRVQSPGLKMEVAIALRGGQGWGKSLWVELFGELFGPHFVAVSGAHGLASNFNKHLLQALLVFGDEMNAAGDKAMVARLKTLVTQTHIQIEPKGVDSFTAPNRFAMIVASNDDRVVEIDPDDRRWLALDVSPSWKGDLDRFERLVAGWRFGGREAFHDFLMARSLADFNHRRRPITATHTAQVRASFAGAMGIVHAILDRGETPPVTRSGAEQDCPTKPTGEVFVPTGDLLRWARAERLIGNGEGNVEVALGRELARASTYAKTIRASVYGRQVRGVWLSPLSEARRLWADAHGLNLDWSEASASWDVAPAAGEIAPGEVPF